MTLDGDDERVVKKQRCRSGEEIIEAIKKKTTTSAQDFANELLRRSDILRSDPHEMNKNDVMPTITQTPSVTEENVSLEKKNVPSPRPLPQPENVYLEKRNVPSPRPLPQPENVNLEKKNMPTPRPQRRQDPEHRPRPRHNHEQSEAQRKPRPQNLLRARKKEVVVFEVGEFQLSTFNKIFIVI